MQFPKKPAFLDLNELEWRLLAPRIAFQKLMQTPRGKQFKLEDSERQDILNVAPSEGNRPLSIFRDKCCEELAYPSIFVGMKRPEIKERKVKVGNQYQLSKPTVTFPQK